MSAIDVKVNVIFQSEKATAALDKVDDQVKKTKKSSDKMTDAFKLSERAFNSFVGNLAANVFINAVSGVRNAIAGTVQASMELEDALVGVAKTADLSGDEVEQLRVRFQQMSQAIPLTTNELLDIGKVAAQMGTKGVSDIARFTETMAKLSLATDIVGEEGTIKMARFLNSVGKGVGDVEALSSVLVDLGNNFELNERELLNVATSLGQSTAQFRLQATEITALATVFKSYGIEAELAGTNTQAVFRAMSKASAEGGANISEFARFAGVSVLEFTDLLDNNAGVALIKFTEGLDRAGLKGNKLTPVLARLGLENGRVGRIVNALTENVDKYRDALIRGNTQIKDSTALSKEFSRVNATASSDVKKFSSSVVTLSSTVGTKLIAAFGPALLQMAELVNNINDAGNRATDFSGKLSRGVVAPLNTTKEKLEAVTIEFQKQQRSVRTLHDEYSGFLGGFRDQSVLDEAKQKLAELGKEVTDLRTLLAQETEIADAAAKAAQQEAEKLAARKAAALRESEFVAIFNETKLTAAETAFAEDLTMLENHNNDVVNTLVKGLGRAEAARVVSQARELKDAGKHAEASLLVKTKLTKAKKLNDEQDIKERDEFLNTAASLARSGNKTFAAIGQAAALTQIAIKTPVAVGNSYEFGSRIGGPITGALFGGIAAAAMAAQAAQVTGLSFEQGGVVPGSSFSGDNVAANVNSGEMILNRQQQAQLFAQSNGSSPGEGSQEIVSNITVELDGEVVTKAVSRSVANGTVLGEDV